MWYYKICCLYCFYNLIVCDSFWKTTKGRTKITKIKTTLLDNDHLRRPTGKSKHIWNKDYITF